MSDEGESGERGARGRTTRHGEPLPSRPARRQWLHVAGVVAVYLVLLLPTVGRQGIGWDEQTDLLVARAYLKPGGWLAGSGIDPSQTRLPMFTVALVYALLGRSDLATARLVSCALGLLTLLGAYVAGRQRLGHVAGMTAAALLATSPFFLSSARLAFTESDVFLACALVWLLAALQHLQERPSIARGAAAGLAMGLALSAKATAVATLPVAWLAAARAGRLLPARSEGSPLSSRGAPSRASSLALVLLVTAVAVVTFFLVPPEHFTNPAILRSLGRRFDREMSWSPAFMAEAAGLHVLSILFKSGPLLGGWLLLSWLVALVRWRRETRLPALLVSFYLAALVLLPLAQTFYTIPLLPFLCLMAADLYGRFLARFRRTAVGAGLLAATLLVADLVLCYPDYNLNGYQWVGARLLAGRPSVGYRGVVQTPSDGVEQAFAWLHEHARPGERVRAYVLESHIVASVAPARTYRLEYGFDGRASPDPDYVVVAINARIRQDWWTSVRARAVFEPPYDPAWLASRYTRVFAVERAFGIEMASVWRRKT